MKLAIKQSTATFLLGIAALLFCLLPVQTMAREATLPQQACPQFSTEGQGEPVFLIPGLASSPETYRHLVDQLKDDYQFTLVSISGFAGTPVRKSKQEDPIDQLVGEIAACIRDQNAGPVRLIGHSMGGYSALKLAHDHPELVRSVLVVDALPFYPLIFNEHATVEQVQPNAEQMRSQILGMDDSAFAAMQKNTVQILASKTEDQQRILQWSLDTDRASMANAVYSLMTGDMRDQLSEISAPVTVLYASNPYFPEARATGLYAQAYAPLEHKQLVNIDNSRHFIMLDQPEAFVEAARRFMAE